MSGESVAALEKKFDYVLLLLLLLSVFTNKTKEEKEEEASKIVWERKRAKYNRAIK